MSIETIDIPQKLCVCVLMEAAVIVIRTHDEKTVTADACKVFLDSCQAATHLDSPLYTSGHQPSPAHAS